MRAGAKMLMIRNESNRARNNGGSGGRNEMRGAQNEMGYGEMRTGTEMENRFRDRRGREHYDNGRFAPRNEMGYEEMRGEYGGMRGAENEMRDARNEMRGARNEMGYGEMRNEMGYGMRGEMRGAQNEMRGEMRGAQNEMRVGMRSEGGQSHYPFGPVPPIYERGAEMNRIGFVVPIGRSEFGGEYRSDAAYSAMDEMGYKTQNAMMGGASGKTMELTEEMAHEWMQGLENEDGTKGPHWTKEQTKQVMTQKGVKLDPIDFWVIMNAMYSDYCGVFKKHNANNIDFYVDLTKAWLEDKDAKEGKAARYFQYIVK